MPHPALRLVVLAALAAGLAVPSRAQHRHIERYSVAEGLPQAIVYDLAQDAHGRMWFATDGGVARFDGRRFESYTVSDGLPTNHVRSLALDGRGHLWLALGEAGLVRYDGRRFERVALGEGRPPHTFAVRIVGDDVWAGTADGVYRRTGDGPFRAVRPAPDSSLGPTSAIAAGAGGAVWFATDAGPVRYRRGALDRPTPITHQVFDVLEADGSLWVASRAEGAFVLDAQFNVERRYRVGPGGLAGGAESLGLDASGDVWVGTTSGPCRLGPPGQHADCLAPEAGVDAALVYRIRADREGGLWFATHGSGAFRYAGFRDGRDRFAIYSDDHGLASNSVWGTGATRDGVFISHSRGVTRIGPGGADELSLPGGEPIQYAAQIVPDGAGGLWIGSASGLLRYRDGRVTRTPGIDGSDATYVITVLQRKNGETWGAADGRGLFAVRGGRTEFFEVDGIDPANDRVLSLDEGPDGTVWVGSHHTVTAVAPGGAVRTFTAADGVPDGAKWLTVAPDGTVWIGNVASDLVRIRPDGTVRAGRLDGRLAGAAIYLVHVDRAGGSGWGRTGGWPGSTGPGPTPTSRTASTGPPRGSRRSSSTRTRSPRTPRATCGSGRSPGPSATTPAPTPRPPPRPGRSSRASACSAAPGTGAATRTGSGATASPPASACRRTRTTSRSSSGPSRSTTPRASGTSSGWPGSTRAGARPPPSGRRPTPTSRPASTSSPSASPRRTGAGARRPPRSRSWSSRRGGSTRPS